MSDLDQAKKQASSSSGPIIELDALTPGKSSTSSSMSGGAPKSSGIIQDPSYGQLQGAGDEAAFKVMGENVKLDTVLNVSADRGRVAELLTDIGAQTKVLKEANKEDDDVENKFGALSTNIRTQTKLGVLDDKLDVGNVDTAAFGYQYKYAKTDFQRLLAEATEYTALTGKKGADPLATVGDDTSQAGGMKLATSPERERFRAARANLNTSAAKMKGKVGLARMAANRFQASLYSVREKAAAASKAEAAEKLASIRAEIDSVAKGVGTAVKIVSAVSGLAAGGGATNALGSAKAAADGGGATISPSDFAKQTGYKDVHVLTPEDHSQVDLVKAIGTDVASVAGGGGGVDGLAESLVKAIGTYANKEKISNLSNTIITKSAEEAEFKAAAEAHTMVASRDEMESHANELSLLMKTFFAAKKEMDSASEDLMASLAKGGAGAGNAKEGKKQARAVMFLKDADKFLAQVQTAIDVGENQQANLKQAALDRKKLRGTSAALEGGEEFSTATYFKCHKITTPGTLWGTNTQYKLEQVFVKFQDQGTVGTHNDIVQGGQGSVEGTGSATDVVASQIDVLKGAQKKVRELQIKVQDALGMGEAGLNS